MPLAPDAIGTDVEKFHVWIAVITIPQRGDKVLLFGQVNRVGIIRLNARNAPSAAGRISPADGVVKSFAAEVKKPFG